MQRAFNLREYTSRRMRRIWLLLPFEFSGLQDQLQWIMSLNDCVYVQLDTNPQRLRKMHIENLNGQVYLCLEVDTPPSQEAGKNAGPAALVGNLNGWV